MCLGFPGASPFSFGHREAYLMLYGITRFGAYGTSKDFAELVEPFILVATRRALLLPLVVWAKKLNQSCV